MRDIHLNRELLRAIAKGEVEPRLLVSIGLEHLRCLCPTCAMEWDEWEKEKRALATDRLPGFLAAQLKAIESAEADAVKDFQQLLDLEPTRRVGRIVRSRHRYRSAALVRLLIAEGRKTVHSDHEKTFHFADLAFHVADRLTGSEMAQGLVPLTLAEKANALRLTVKIREAREFFDRSRALIEIANLRDPSVIARIDQLEASLYFDLRCFSEAQGLLDRAKILYGLVGAASDVARIEIMRSLVFLEAGQPLQALQVAREISQSAPVVSDQKLFLWARINLARALFETRDLRAAKRVLDQDEPRHAQLGEPLAQVRYRWIRGRIAAAERDFAEAREHFLWVRNEFIEAEAMYDAAQVSLDLALASLQLGRPEVVRELTDEMMPIFKSLDIHREALAALRLFQEAVHQEILTEALVRDLRAYLQEARYQPEVRFHPGAGANN